APEGEQQRLERLEAERAFLRARCSVDLLRLGGWPPEEVQRLNEALDRARGLRDQADALRPVLSALGSGLLQTWTEQVPRALAQAPAVSARDRLRRVSLPFDPLQLSDSPRTVPQVQRWLQQMAALWTWRADQVRYEARDLTSAGMLSEAGERFYADAARRYQPLAQALPEGAYLQLVATPTALPLTPQAPAAQTEVLLRRFAPAGLSGETGLRLFAPEGDWLQVTPAFPPELIRGIFPMPAGSFVQGTLGVELKAAAVRSA